MTYSAKIAIQTDIAVSCGTIITNAAGQILLCHVTGMNHWDIPKGVREPDELSFDAAKRELHEETGLAFDDELFQELGEFEFVRDKRLHLYLVRAPKNFIRLKHLQCTSHFSHPVTGHPTPEMDGFCWAARDDIRTMCTLPMAKQLLALHW